MVLAVVYFDVTDSAGFESALTRHAGSVTKAKGYHSHSLRRGVEEPGRYLLLVEWESVADHEAWQKAHAKEFLGALGPTISGGPTIRHFA